MIKRTPPGVPKSPKGKGRGTPPPKHVIGTPPPQPKLGRGRGTPPTNVPALRKPMAKTLINVPSPIENLQKTKSPKHPSKLLHTHSNKTPPIVKPVSNLDQRLKPNEDAEFNPFKKSNVMTRTPPQQQNQQQTEENLRRSTRPKKPVDRYGNWA